MAPGRCYVGDYHLHPSNGSAKLLRNDLTRNYMGEAKRNWERTQMENIQKF